jgi:Zn-finger nucleic acid-binding protein
MKCPLDGSDLAMSERHGIEVDYCPKCRGVWLDRGELDKIVERATPDEPVDRQPDRPREPDRPRDHDRPRYDDDRKYSGRPYKKRKSLLDDIFDF